MVKETKLNLPLSRDLLEKLAECQEIELDDVEIEIEEIEFDIGGGGGGFNPQMMQRMAFEFSVM